ncbi:MAG: metal-dependent transcriptional regulator [Ruminococcaceae bacterium]|nr:metal-dependent transcriptional regulator [Oscillospiraceae bacterium]
MQLQESAEMYLESIYVLSGRLPIVRSIDICEHRGVSKPSVSRAVGILKQGGYILCGEDGGLTLTDIGREVAEKIYERHTVLTEYLVSLGIGRETASEDACKIEHVISDETFDAIKQKLK